MEKAPTTFYKGPLGFKGNILCQSLITSAPTLSWGECLQKATPWFWTISPPCQSHQPDLPVSSDSHAEAYMSAEAVIKEHYEHETTVKPSAEVILAPMSNTYEEKILLYHSEIWSLTF